MYDQFVMLFRMAGGDDRLVIIIANLGSTAARFDSHDVGVFKDVAYQYLNVRSGFLTPTRLEGYFVFESYRTPDGRRIVIRTHQSGVVQIEIWRAWPNAPGVPWDWLLGEAYTGLLCLQDKRVRKLYGANGTISTTIGLANVLDTPVGTAGLRMPLSQSAVQGVLSRIPAVPLQSLHWSLAADEDPWEQALRFVRTVLADTGVMYFEKDLDAVRRETFESLYFHHYGPTVKYWRPGQQAPEAI